MRRPLVLCLALGLGLVLGLLLGLVLVSLPGSPRAVPPAAAQDVLRAPEVGPAEGAGTRSAAAPAPTRPWVVDRTGLTAVPIPAQGWCPTPRQGGDGVVRLRVDALDARAYRAPRLALQRFLSGVRFVVQQDCPQVWAIEVQGYAAGTRRFLGSLVRDEDWRLEGTLLE